MQLTESHSRVRNGIYRNQSRIIQHCMWYMSRSTISLTQLSSVTSPQIAWTQTTATVFFNSLVISDFSKEDTKHVYQCTVTRIGTDDLHGLYPRSGPRRLCLLGEERDGRMKGEGGTEGECERL